ncbi:MAG: hypothetical protein IJQ60_17530 [Prevotella sp.]|nr:hypothetical protein [Prevotella sp.]
MKPKYFLIMLTLAMGFALTSVMTSCSKEESPYIKSSLDVTDPDGTLEVSETNIRLPSDGKPVKLIATYKSSKGLYEPTAITMCDEDGNKVIGVQDGDNMTFDIVREGTYTVSAGSLSLKVIAISMGSN